MTEHVLSLPIPPSKNDLRVYRRGRVYTSDAYRKWEMQADKYMFANKPMGGWETIKGQFDAEIIIDKSANGKADPQNRVEAIFDYAQRLGLVENDRNLRNHQVTLGNAPVGVRVTLRGVERGSEEIDGVFNPISLGDAANSVVENLRRKLAAKGRMV